MSLSKDDLRVGNTVYRLDLNNNMLKRDKIYMTDSQGVEWSRYDLPMWTFTVTTMKICGSIKQLVSGKVDGDSISEDEYHLNYAPVDWASGVIEPYGVGYLTTNDPNCWTFFFANEAEAEAAGETYCVNRNTQT